MPPRRKHGVAHRPPRTNMSWHDTHTSQWVFARNGDGTWSMVNSDSGFRYDYKNEQPVVKEAPQNPEEIRRSLNALLSSGTTAREYIEKRTARLNAPSSDSPRGHGSRDGPMSADRQHEAHAHAKQDRMVHEHTQNKNEASRMTDVRKAYPNYPWVFVQSADDGSWRYLNVETGFEHTCGSRAFARNGGLHQAPPAFLKDPDFLKHDTPTQDHIRAHRVALSRNTYGSTYVRYDQPWAPLSICWHPPPVPIDSPAGREGCAAV